MQRRPPGHVFGTYRTPRPYVYVHTVPTTREFSPPGYFLRNYFGKQRDTCAQEMIRTVERNIRETQSRIWIVDPVGKPQRVAGIQWEKGLSLSEESGGELVHPDSVASLINGFAELGGAQRQWGQRVPPEAFIDLESVAEIAVAFG